MRPIAHRETDAYVAEMVSDGFASSFAVYSKTDGQISYTDNLDERYVPYWPTHGFSRVMIFPSAAEDHGSERDLIDDIRAFIRKWVDIEPVYESICAYYVLLSWQYDKFYEMPYLRVLADLGSGKSRLGIDVLGRILFRPIRTSAATSTAAIFRILDAIGGTLILDEADLGEHSDKTSDFIQILNSGYKRDIPVLRCDGAGSNRRVEPFDVFGPKVILGRERMKDHALESRCLTVRLTQTTRKDLPLTVDETLEPEALSLRNRLLHWRFVTRGTEAKKATDTFMALDISPRFKQLFIVLSTVVTDEDALDQLIEYAETLNVEAAALRSESFAGEVAGAVSFLLGCGSHSVTEDGEWFLSYQQIAERINEDRGKDAKQITPRGVSRSLRDDMALPTGKYGTAGERGLRATESDIRKVLTSFGYAPSRPQDTPLPPL